MCQIPLWRFLVPTFVLIQNLMHTLHPICSHGVVLYVGHAKLSCCFWICLTKHGSRRSKWEVNFLLFSISAGDDPVTVCGVIQYLNRNRATLVFRVPPSIFLIDSLNVCTALSANPFDDGWYAADVIYQIPFRVMNSLYSSLVKHGPLSLSRISGNHWLAKVTLSFSIVASDVDDLVGCTSIHLTAAMWRYDYFHIHLWLFMFSMSSLIK